ncbi:hypothetical protein DF186_20450, partial [Enterococcus hirae]
MIGFLLFCCVWVILKWLLICLNWFGLVGRFGLICLCRLVSDDLLLRGDFEYVFDFWFFGYVVVFGCLVCLYGGVEIVGVD